MLRKSTRDDACSCSELIYLSGPHLFSYLYCEKEPEIYQLIEQLFKAPNTTFSHKTATVSEKDGEVQGLIIAHPVPLLQKLTLNEIRYLLRTKDTIFKSVLHFLKMIFRINIVRFYPPLKSSEYFIANLAVFKEYRGQGIAVQLLKRTEQDAKEKGFNKLSLFVESDNTHAKRVYEKYGFKEEKTSQFPKKYNKYGLIGFIKMIKEI